MGYERSQLLAFPLLSIFSYFLFFLHSLWEFSPKEEEEQNQENNVAGYCYNELIQSHSKLVSPYCHMVVIRDSLLGHLNCMLDGFLNCWIIFYIYLKIFHTPTNHTLQLQITYLSFTLVQPNLEFHIGLVNFLD